MFLWVKKKKKNRHICINFIILKCIKIDFKLMNGELVIKY